MDQLINCTRCSSDCCYVQEVSPEVKTYFCYGCGFTTNSLMKEGEQFFIEQQETLPELYKALFYTDDEGKIWMPSAINLPTQGMVFANGNNAENWKWSAVKAIPVSEEEKTKYPIPGKKGEYYEFRMAMDTIAHFDEKDFIESLSYIKVLPE